MWPWCCGMEGFLPHQLQHPVEQPMHPFIPGNSPVTSCLFTPEGIATTSPHQFNQFLGLICMACQTLSLKRFRERRTVSWYLASDNAGRSHGIWLQIVQGGLIESGFGECRAVSWYLALASAGRSCGIWLRIIQGGLMVSGFG